MREKINIEEVAKKHNVNIEIAKKAIDYIEEIAGLWYDNYYKANKFKTLNNAIEKIMQNDKEFAQHYSLYWTKRAISTHLRDWFGWRVKEDSVLLRCKWYGGYVFVIVAEKREVVRNENKN